MVINEVDGWDRDIPRIVYDEEVYIDTTNFTLEIRDYGEVPLLFHELSFNDL